MGIRWIAAITIIIAGGLPSPCTAGPTTGQAAAVDADSAAASTPLLDPDTLRFSLQGTYFYGPVHGFVQTPAGGQPGTTSIKRPRLGEIGIHDASIADAELDVALHHDELYVGGQYPFLSGSDRLGSSLISHGVSFPAGSEVNSDVRLDWYRFGYRRQFVLGDKNEFMLAPSVGAAITDFNYRLDGNGARTDRAYIHITGTFGLQFEWRLNGGPFSIDLDLLGSPPISPPLPVIGSERLLIHYRFLDKSTVRADLFGGLAFEQLYFEDNQRVPNRQRVEFGPLVAAGVGLKF